jgi:hypothetical protein
MESLGGARCSRRGGRFASAFPWGEQGALLPRGSKLHSKVRVGRRDSVTDEVFGRDRRTCPDSTPQLASRRRSGRVDFARLHLAARGLADELPVGLLDLDRLVVSELLQLLAQMGHLVRVVLPHTGPVGGLDVFPGC